MPPEGASTYAWQAHTCLCIAAGMTPINADTNCGVTTGFHEKLEYGYGLMVESTPIGRGSVQTVHLSSQISN
ncbi:MAG TPA: hypothetical protein VIO58_14835 [Candidatus Methanoperedens sp.]